MYCFAPWLLCTLTYKSLQPLHWCWYSEGVGASRTTTKQVQKLALTTPSVLFPACYRNSNINEILDRESLRVVRDGLLRLKFDPVRPQAQEAKTHGHAHPALSALA
jgi:hypothetical protein